MIVYRLTCKNEHEFEAWFRDSAACDAQIAEGRVACPHCAEVSVRKSLMTPNVAPKGADSAPDRPSERRTAMMRGLRELRRKVEENCDYVGRAYSADP